MSRPTIPSCVVFLLIASLPGRAESADAVQTILTVGSTLGSNNGRHSLLTGRSNTLSQEVAVPMPAAGVIRNWTFRQLTAPGSGKSWTWKIQKNGTDTDLAITISDTNTEGFDADGVYFDAGDTIRITSTKSGTAAESEWQSSIEFDADADGVSIYGFGANNASSTALNYDSALYGTNFGAVSGEQFSIVAVAGTVTTWRIAINGTPGTGKSRTFTFVKNGVAQDGTGGTPDTRITIADSASSGSGSFSLSLAVNDQLQVRHTPTNTPGGTWIVGALAFTATTTSQWTIGNAWTTAMNTSGTPTYHWPVGGDQTGSATESSREAIVGASRFVVSAMRARVASAPGAGKSWTLTLRRNQTDTPFSVTISGTNVEGSVTGSFLVSPGDRLSIKAVAAGVPSSITARSWVSLLVDGDEVIEPPIVTMLNPSVGIVGQTVTIQGFNFGSTQGTSAVTFNGTTAAVTSWSDTSISVTVPTGATTGVVVVSVSAHGVSSEGVMFTVLDAAPVITALSPTSGTPAQAITIDGTSFGATQGTTTVTFNGTGATATSWSNTRIGVTVPAGATTGPVVVTRAGLSSNGVTFTLLQSPATSVRYSYDEAGRLVGVIDPAGEAANYRYDLVGNLTSIARFSAGQVSILEFSPNQGPIGATVTIEGTGFSATPAQNTVQFNGVTASVISASTNQLVVTVPATATSGTISITTPSGSAVSAEPFVVTP
ncbi:MAG TPA: IPT/TIG domain-containing protein [Vicinamibacterales bacterium]|nr:IPT/TIG domain-containing protein [Vicinamibacterales bacterium]